MLGCPHKTDSVVRPVSGWAVHLPAVELVFCKLKYSEEGWFLDQPPRFRPLKRSPRR